MTSRVYESFDQSKSHFPAKTIISPGFHSMLSAHGYPDPTSGFKERHDPHSAHQGGADRQDSE